MSWQTPKQKTAQTRYFAGNTMSVGSSGKLSRVSFTPLIQLITQYITQTTGTLKSHFNLSWQG
ncbi:MAG: hypothetical protein Q4A69_02020 [Moraxella sp.]|nr:hypothetical protein [Moraxella sp.]